MKILISATTYPRHKGDTIPDFVHNFAVHLRAQSWVSEVHVLAPHAENTKTNENMDGVFVHRYRYWPSQKGENITYGGSVGKIKKTPLYAVKLLSLIVCQFFATYKIVSEKKIDVINAHWLVPMGFLAVVLGSLTRTPVIVTIHGGDVFSLKSGLMSRIKAWTLRHAGAVVPNSSATKKEAEKLYAGREYPVIPMGVDVENLQALPKKPRAKNAPLRLLFAGRLAPEKGVQYLLDALAILRDKSIEPTVRIAGIGPMEAELHEKASELKLSSVEFLGWVSHEKYPELFANADVFVGPSIVSESGWQEAFGLVFAESLALHTPVIATNTGGISDIVENNKNGILVPQRDARALALAIEEFVENPELCVAMIKNSRADIETKFSWSKCISQYAPIFQQATARKTKDQVRD